MIFNIKKVGYKFIVVIIIKSNFNIDITKDELCKVLKDNDEEFKTLLKVEKELIIPKIKLSRTMLNPKQNNLENRWGKQEIRGGEEYTPPLGWTNYAINIEHNFNDKSGSWLSKHNKNEWPIAYCWLKGKQNIEQIYENDDDIKHQGKKVGIGVYCTSDPAILEELTEEIDINGENYKIGFLIRVNPEKIRVSEKNKKVWIVNGNDREFRPYGILLKNLKNN